MQTIPRTHRNDPLSSYIGEDKSMDISKTQADLIYKFLKMVNGKVTAEQLAEYMESRLTYEDKVRFTGNSKKYTVYSVVSKRMSVLDKNGKAEVVGMSDGKQLWRIKKD